MLQKTNEKSQPYGAKMTKFLTSDLGTEFPLFQRRFSLCYIQNSAKMLPLEKDFTWLPNPN